MTTTNPQTLYDKAKESAQKGQGMPDTRAMTSDQREKSEAGFKAGQSK